MVDSPALEPGRVVAGRYRVEKRIGEGGMGAVYLVRHVHTDESLALKVLHAHVLKDDSAVERFRREARAPARIASEHVARVTDADTAPDLDGAPFYVMELLRGRDLERIVAEDGPLSPVLLVEYLHQAARALDKAHAMGIVHRDLKPENLFLTEREDGSPCIKLLDFGIARLWETDAPGQMKTQSGYVFGTPAFLSPEQAMGNVDAVGPTTDVWALGLLVFKVLVGREFWGAQNMAHLYAMILSEPIPAPSTRGSTFGPAFDAWFAKCLAREGANRFPSAGAAVQALAEALGVRLSPIRRSSASLVAAAELGDGPLQAPSGSHPLPTSQTRASVGMLPVAPSVTSGGAPDAPAAAPAPPPKSARMALIAGICVVGVAAGVIGVVLALPAKPSGIVAASPSGSVSTTALSLPQASAASSDAPLAEASGTLPPTVIVPTPLAAADSAEPRPPALREGNRAGGAATAKPGTSRSAAPAAEAPLTRDQRRRLETLQRLCDQGTFTPTECKTKRTAIMHEP